MPEFHEGGASLYYEECGEGDAVLLLHGNGADLHDFDRQIPVLAERYHVVAMDTRGHGCSTHGEGELCFERFADDAAALLKSLGIPRAHLVGFSDGGNTALYFAIRYPHMARSLLLAGANTDPSGLALPVRAADWLGFWVLTLFSHLSEAALRKREIVGLMVRHPDLTSVQLASISAPALVLCGSHDVIRRKHSEMIARNLRRAELRVVRGAGHFTLRDRTEEFNRLMLEFLEGADERALAPIVNTAAL